MNGFDLRSHRERQKRALRFRKPRQTVRGVKSRDSLGEISAPEADSGAESAAKAAKAAEFAALKAAKRAKNRKRLRGFVKVLLFAAEILLLCAVVYGLITLQRRTQPVSFELRYLVPNRDDIVETVTAGDSIPLHEPVELNGYRFLFWERPDGTPETEAEVSPSQNTVYTARYALAFPTEKHIAYLSVDSDGVFGVNDPVTVRELVVVLYELLDLDRTGKGTFLDVDSSDPCYRAAATLKDLGILHGDWLYPDDRITRADLFELLSRFYPAAGTSFSFSDLEQDDEYWPAFCVAAERGWITGDRANASEPLQRGEMARILNRVLGRSPAAAPPDSAVGMILDVPPTHPYYADIAEAVIPHQFAADSGGERWTESSPLPNHEPGQFFAGVKLHYIGEDGVPAVNTSIGGHSYNECGELTSGIPELDKQLWQILESTVDPEAMSQEEMLREVYDYVVKNFSREPGTLYSFDSSGWEAEAALQLLEDGRGSSYNYAALFYELSSFIGYSPVLRNGIIYGQQTVFEAMDGTEVRAHGGYTPHAWVEIRLDGISYLFDAEMEAQYNGLRSFYKFYDPVRWQKGYRSNF